MNDVNVTGDACQSVSQSAMQLLLVNRRYFNAIHL